MTGKTPSKILIVGPAWIGDMVMAQALFKALKEQYPALEIDVLASAWTLPLLARMPEVANTIEMPLGHGAIELGLRKQLGQFLAPRNYDQAIVLPNSFKSALVPFFAKIPVRTGWRGEMRYFLINDIRLLSKRRYPLMVSRYLALAYEPGATLSENFTRPHLVIDQHAWPQLLTKFDLSRERPLLILCPGAEYGPAKRWPEEYFTEVAEQKIAEGWQVWLLGSKKDHPVAEQIKTALTPSAELYCRNLAGITELDEAIDLMAMADAVLTNDSGLMHIAAALSRPLVVLYGSTSPSFTPPLADRVKLLTLAVDCGPCFKRECPEGHLKCLRELKPQRVFDAFEQLQVDHEAIAIAANPSSKDGPCAG